MNWSIKCIVFILFSSALILLACTNVIAQNFNKIEKQAIEDFYDDNFVRARDQFLILHEAQWNENETSSFLASCYLELDEPQKSYEILTQVSEPDRVNKYLMILSYYQLEEFDKAIMKLRDLQDTAGLDIGSISKKISMAQQAYASNTGIIIQNFGEEINSRDLEYSAVIYNGYNNLLFTSRKEGGPVMDVDGLAFESIYYTQLDSSDNWQEAIPFSIELNQRRSHDATVQVFSSGEKIILFHDGRLYIASQKDGKWTKEEDLNLHAKKGNDTHCYITQDERTIIFASDYLSGGEHLDLFVSRKDRQGKWTEPTPIIELNTGLDEDSPFLAKDSTLYFSSNGPNSMGGYDVFKSVYDPSTKQWGTPENLGFPINTVADDIYYTTEGKLAYMSSDRAGGYGLLDLYRVFLFNKVKIQGQLIDKDQRPISNAEINVKYDSTTLKGFTDDDGFYELFVPVNTEMHITFIRDSSNLAEGDYIAKVFFKDKNNNEFDLFIDFEGTESEMIDGQKDERVVRHINIDIKKDEENNPIISSIPESEESEWSENVNQAAREERKLDLQNREVSTINREQEGEQVEIISSHLKIRDATIREKTSPRVAGESSFSVEKSSNGTFTVQVLAMSRLKADIAYFEKLNTPIRNKKGNDGTERFYIGEYESLLDAMEAMEYLWKAGYDDAFIRRLDKYAEL